MLYLCDCAGCQGFCELFFYLSGSHCIEHTHFVSAKAGGNATVQLSSFIWDSMSRRQRVPRKKEKDGNKQTTALRTQ